MKKSTLVLSAVALSLGMALSPMSASAAETASAATSQSGTHAGEGDAIRGEHQCGR